MADRLNPLSYDYVNDSVYQGIDDNTVDDKEGGVYKNYLHFFKVNTFYTE